MAAVFVALGFAEGACLALLLALLGDLLPGCHAKDLHGLFRDTAVADVLLHTFLPDTAAGVYLSEVQLLWLTTDFFLTLGAKDLPAPQLLRLWDLLIFSR